MGLKEPWLQQVGTGPKLVPKFHWGEKKRHVLLCGGKNKENSLVGPTRERGSSPGRGNPEDMGTPNFHPVGSAIPEKTHTGSGDHKQAWEGKVSKEVGPVGGLSPRRRKDCFAAAFKKKPPLKQGGGQTPGGDKLGAKTP